MNREVTLHGVYGKMQPTRKWKKTLSTCVITKFRSTTIHVVVTDILMNLKSNLREGSV